MAQQFIKSRINDTIYSVGDSRDALVTLTATNKDNFHFTLMRQDYELIREGKSATFEMMTGAVHPTITITKSTAPATGTKLERAMAIYQTMPGASRKQVIDAFVKQLNMTPAGASTYQYQCKKALG